MRSRVVVIGAGMAGLVAASALGSTHDVVVVDKGRGVGGRMATRRIGEATFDHGAQFLTTHTERFAELVRDWQAAGVVQPWFRGRLGPDGVAERDGHVRYRGAPSMTAIAKHLAAGLEVRTSCRVERLLPDGSGWTVLVEGGERLGADAIVLTPPVPQTLELLDRSGVTVATAERATLEALTYDPCLAAMVPLAAPSGLPEPGAVAHLTGPVDLVADNATKGISSRPALTIHATPAFSREHWDDPDADILQTLVDAAGVDVADLDTAQLMRWRYARPLAVHPEPSMTLSDVPTAVLAGDAFAGSKVEGAALSGLAAAAVLADV